MGNFKLINKRATATLGESKLVGKVRGEYVNNGTVTGVEFKLDVPEGNNDYFILSLPDWTIEYDPEPIVLPTKPYAMIKYGIYLPLVRGTYRNEWLFVNDSKAAGIERFTDNEVIELIQKNGGGQFEVLYEGRDY
jgi:hypothetical protein